MSRSSFVQRFKATVGAPPMDFLANWRMALAGARLETAREPLSVIAPSLDYDSEAIFSTAFKRFLGCAPRQYGRGNDPTRPQVNGITSPQPVRS